MNSIKIYNKQGNVLLNKNNIFCLIYKYEAEKEIVYSINMNDKHSKYYSIFECIITTKEKTTRVSITEECIEYKTEYIKGNFTEIEEGRIPIKKNKKKWSKKSLWTNHRKLIEIENFNNCRSVIYKPKEEIFTNLININDEQRRTKKRTRN